MHLRFRVPVAVLAPLLLAGCGAPVGVQVASLIADGISFITTEKTLTDHGLSAVAGEDCAVWRGLKGEDICRETDAADHPGVLAEAEAPWEPEGGDAQLPTGAEPSPAPATFLALNVAPPASTSGMRRSMKPEPERTSQLPPPPPAAPAHALAPAPMNKVTATGPLPDVAAAEASRRETAGTPEQQAVVWSAPGQPEPAAPAAAEKPRDRALTARTVTRVPAEAAPQGGLFYVIASYRRLHNAERFAGRQGKLGTVILTGTVKDRPVFRVAVGPVPDDARRHARQLLVKAGYRDVWGLTLTQPKPAVEMAQAR